jgi:hypothetical protein
MTWNWMIVNIISEERTSGNKRFGNSNEKNRSILFQTLSLSLKLSRVEGNREPSRTPNHRLYQGPRVKPRVKSNNN